MPFQSKEEYLDELEDSEAERVARHLINQGNKLKDVREMIERFQDLDWDKHDLFLYLMFDGAVNSFEETLRQTNSVVTTERSEEMLNAYFKIPDHLFGLVDYDKAWDQFCISNSVFNVDGQYYIQEN